MSDPAGASGNPATSSSARAYQPQQQPGADTLFQNLLNPANPNTIGSLAVNPPLTPAGQYYPQAQGIYSNYIGGNPGIATYLQGAGGATQGATDAYLQAQGGVSDLNNYAKLIGNTAFDPQQALYNRTLNQVTQQGAATNAMSGLSGTPYGQSTLDNAIGNFNINWQNNLLNRMATGGQAATALDQGAQSLYGSGLQNLLTGTGAGYNAEQTIGTNQLNALNNLVNLGNNQYILPQQVLSDLESYLNLGQSASQLSGQLGQMGQNQLGTAASGFGALAGSGLGLGSPSNPGYLGQALGLGGSSGLFGSGAASLATPLTAATDFAAAPVIGADFGGGGDLLAAAAPAALAS